MNDREIGDTCIVQSTKEYGICTSVENCPSFFSNRKIRPQICGFQDDKTDYMLLSQRSIYPRDANSKF